MIIIYKKNWFLNKRFLFFKKGTVKFIESAASALPKLKNWFVELQQLDDQDLKDLFVEFVEDGVFEISNERFKRIVAERPVRISEQIVKGGVTNKQPVFETPVLNQQEPVKIEDKNWPENKNFICDPKKLQLNASFPFFVCCKNYTEFIETVNSIGWMNDLKTCLAELFPNSKEEKYSYSYFNAKLIYKKNN